MRLRWSEFSHEVNDERVRGSGELVRVYAAPTFVDLELVEAAFRAHQLPYVVRYKMRYMEPSFAGDELRMSHVLVPDSMLADAQALLNSLRLDQHREPSPRARFDAVLDALGTPQAQSLESVWAVDAEEFGDWMASALPDLLERLGADAVQSALHSLDHPERRSQRDELLRAVAMAPAMTRSAISHALAGRPASDPTSVWTSLRSASDPVGA